jgi:O-antigen ligase
MTKLAKFCTSFIEWSILAAAALAPLIFSFSTVDNFSLPKIVFFRALVLFLVLAWIVKSIEEKKITFARPPLAAVVLIFLTVNVLAAVFGINPKVSFWGAYSKFQGLFTLLHLAVFFLILLSFIKNKKQLERLVLVLIFSSVPISVHAIFQHFGIDFMTSLSHTDIRAFSTLGSALHLGAYLIMIMPLTLAWTFSREKVWQKLMFGAFFVLQCFALLFTYTRSAWLGIVFGLIFFFPAWAVKQKSLRNTAAVSAGILFLILFCVSLFSRANILHLPKGNEFLERAASIFDLKSESNAQRLVVWQKSAEIIKARPILGYGPENFYYAFFKNYPPELTKLPEPNFDRAHNQVLDLGVTTGVLGIISFVGIILFTFYYGF